VKQCVYVSGHVLVGNDNTCPFLLWAIEKSTGNTNHRRKLGAPQEKRSVLKKEEEDDPGEAFWHQWKSKRMKRDPIVLKMKGHEGTLRELILLHKIY